MVSVSVYVTSMQVFILSNMITFADLYKGISEHSDNNVYFIPLVAY